MELILYEAVNRKLYKGGAESDAFESGGTCDWYSMIETKGKWTIDLEHAVLADGKPFLLKGIAEELSDVMNEHVEWGCCGGCF